MASLNPRLTIKKPAWVCWVVAIVFLAQATGCKHERSGAKVAPAVISGNSMAPHFLGKHQSTVCGGCGFKIVSEIAPATNDATLDISVVCPNCGFLSGPENQSQTQPAVQVSLHLGQLPKRWQVIGFQRSNDDQASIKRVIGLPGETVWFEHGNILVQTKDGKAELVKKNWAEQKLTRVLVHDNQFQDDTPRWSPLKPADALSANVPAKFQTPEYRWLSYQPKRCYEHSSKQAWSPQIEDSYGFNQSINRSLNRVNEVCLEFEFDPTSKWEQAGGAELLTAIVFEQQTHLARFVFNHDSVDVQLFNQDKQVTAVTRCQIDPESPTCAISNVDSQIMVAVGDEQVLLLDLSSSKSDTLLEPSSLAESDLLVEPSSLAINSPVELLISLRPSNPVGLKGLRVWRDIYFFSPLSRDELLRRQAGTGLAGTEGYFVAGDNLPVSWDSRRWLLPRVDAKDILGVVDIGQ